MANEQILTTLTFTKDDATVVGSGETFLTDLAAGHVVKRDINNQPIYEIASVTDDNTFELTAPYAGATVTGAAVIQRSFTPVYRFARLFAGDHGGAEILTRQVIDKLEDLFTGAYVVPTEVIITSSRVLVSGETSETTINNYGQTDNVNVTLHPAEEGRRFTVILGTTVAKYFRLTADPVDKIYLNGTAGNDGGYVQIVSGEAGASCSFASFKTGANEWNWLCIKITGTDWVAG